MMLSCSVKLARLVDTGLIRAIASSAGKIVFIRVPGCLSCCFVKLLSTLKE